MLGVQSLTTTSASTRCLPRNCRPREDLASSGEQREGEREREGGKERERGRERERGERVE